MIALAFWDTGTEQHIQTGVIVALIPIDLRFQSSVACFCEGLDMSAVFGQRTLFGGLSLSGTWLGTRATRGSCCLELELQERNHVNTRYSS
jgi:hypothetical protein